VSASLGEDQAFILGLFGAIAGYRQENGSVGGEGKRLASILLQPTMPDINEYIKDPSLVDRDLYMVERSDRALKVVLMFIQKA
jgi:hypothetical protein